MTTSIDKTGYDLALSGSLSEVFEMMIGQRYYLNVLKGDEQFVATLDEISLDAGCFNASHYWAVTNDRYEFEALIDEGKIKRVYWAFDDRDDALKFANDMLFAYAD